MPVKSDLFPIFKEIGDRAGMVTIKRGFWLPSEVNFGPEKYPAMGFWENTETVKFGSLGFKNIGSVSLGIWLHAKHVLTVDSTVGQLFIPDEASLLELDEMHDVFASLIAKAFNPDDPIGSIVSQTISPATDGREVEWISQWAYAESPHVGAVLVVPYQMNCAPR